MVLIARVLLFGLTLAVLAYASAGRHKMRRLARATARPRLVALPGSAAGRSVRRRVVD